MSAARKPLLLSWSGGKDATWALHLLRQSSEFNVVALLTTFNTDSKEAAGQSVSHSKIVSQAQTLNLPLFEMWIPLGADNARYQTVFSESIVDVKRAFPDLRDIAFGDISLADIKAWRIKLCAANQLRAHFPLFGMDSSLLARQMISAGLKAKISALDSTRIPASLMDADFDVAFLNALPAGIDACGENGEFQTHALIAAGTFPLVS